MADTNNKEKRTASYIFGSILLAFFIWVFLFAPDTLPDFKQKMLAFSAALLAGLFSYFFTGTLKLTGQTPKTAFGKIAIQATSGIAIFVLVLVWWLSPNAPITPKIIDKIDSGVTKIDTAVTDIKSEIFKIENKDVTAKVTYTIAQTSLEMPDIFKNSAQLEIRFSDSNSTEKIKTTGWKNGFFLNEICPRLTSTTQSFDRKLNPTTENTSIELIRQYTAFSGRLKSFEQRSKWKNASFEGLIKVSELNKWIDTLKADVNQEFPVTMQDVARKYKTTEQEIADLQEYSNIRISEYPIFAKLELFYKEQLIGSSEAIVVKIWEGDEDVKSKFVVKFHFGSN